MMNHYIIFYYVCNAVEQVTDIQHVTTIVTLSINNDNK